MGLWLWNCRLVVVMKAGTGGGVTESLLVGVGCGWEIESVCNQLFN